MSIHSHDKRAIAIEVRRTVAGLLKFALEDGRLSQDTSKLKLTEREGVVTWTVKLGVDESKELTYRYERYVPSH